MKTHDLALISEASLEQIPMRVAEDATPEAMRFICHRLSAGFPSPAADYAQKTLDLNTYLVNNKTATFLFSVKGDSMVGAAIEDGDKVVVDRSVKPRHGDIVVAVVDGDYTIKRLYKRQGIVELRPENEAYEPIRFTEGRDLEIWGVVVGVVRKYRSSL